MSRHSFKLSLINVTLHRQEHDEVESPKKGTRLTDLCELATGNWQLGGWVQMNYENGWDNMHILF